MSTHRKRIVLIVGAAVGAVLLWSVLAKGRAPHADPAASAAPSVSVVTARRTPLRITLALSGEFKPFQEVDLHAKVAGYIKTISVDVGDRVKAGQVLAVLEIPELQAQLQEADASLDRSRSAHDMAHSAYERLKQVSEARPGLIAAQELEDAYARDKQAEAQVAQASASLRQASALSDYSQHHGALHGRDHAALRRHGRAHPGGHVLEHAGDAGRASGRGRQAPARPAGARIRGLEDPRRHDRRGARPRARPDLRRARRPDLRRPRPADAHDGDRDRRRQPRREPRRRDVRRDTDRPREERRGADGPDPGGLPQRRGRERSRRQPSGPRRAPDGADRHGGLEAARDRRRASPRESASSSAATDRSAPATKSGPSPRPRTRPRAEGER